MAKYYEPMIFMYHAFDMIDPDHELSRIAIGRFHRHFAFAVNHYFAPQE